jgi:hypothetical protein
MNADADVHKRAKDLARRQNKLWDNDQKNTEVSVLQQALRLGLDQLEEQVKLAEDCKDLPW